MLSRPFSRISPSRSFMESLMPGHILEPDDAPVLCRLEVDLADLRDGLELARDPQGIFEPALVDGPALETAVEGVDAGRYGLDTQAVKGEETGD